MTFADAQLSDEPIVIYRTGNRFRLIASERGLTSEGEDLESAYADLRQLMNAQAAEQPMRSGMRPIGRPSMPAGERPVPVASGMTRLLQAALLVLVVSVLPLMFFAASALSNVAGLVAGLRNATHLAQSQSGDKTIATGATQEKRRFVVQMLHNIAEETRDLTPEREREVLRDVHTIVKAAQPFADAIRPLFTGNVDQPYQGPDVNGHGGAGMHKETNR